MDEQRSKLSAAMIFSLLFAMVLMTSCRQTKGGGATIFPSDCHLQEGDIVFRKGSGLTSHAVIYAERDGVYSHTGIVAATDSGMMIVHAVPGEPDFKGDDDRVKVERPEVFFSVMRAERGEVRRHRDRETARKASQKALEAFQRHTLFDHDYNDQDTTEMYCTELIVHSYRAAGHPLTDIKRDTVDFLFLHTKCILPSSLLNSRHFFQVKRF